MRVRPSTAALLGLAFILSLIAWTASSQQAWRAVAADCAQVVQGLVSVVLLVYALGFATELREAIAARHLDGMKYVREIIGTQEAAEHRRWVYTELPHEARPLGEAAKQKVGRIARDFDHIGLLCRNGLLPAEIIATTYARNIKTMWMLLKPEITNLRGEVSDDDYFVEFQWLAELAREKDRSLKRGEPKW